MGKFDFRNGLPAVPKVEQRKVELATSSSQVRSPDHNTTIP